MRRTDLVPLVLFLAMASLCVAAASKPEDQLLNADRDFNKAVSARRVDGWMEYMADDAAIGIGNGAPVIGKEAIRRVMERPFSKPDFSLVWEPTRAEVFPGNQMGYTVGRWTRTVKQGDQTLTAHGTYMTVWQKQKDGTWKVIADGGTDDPAESPKSEPQKP